MESSNYKYEEIVMDLTAAIQEGRYKPEDLLPSESVLCQNYATSRITVRRALAILTNQDLIYSIPGKGSFVKGPSGDFFHLDYKKGLFLSEQYYESQLIAIRVIKPDAEMVYRLDVTPQTNIIEMKWLVYTKGKPVAIDEKYMPYSSQINILHNERNVPDFFTILQDHASPGSIRQDVRIGTSAADKKYAEMLQVQEKSMLWLFDIMLYDDNRHPLGWNRQFILPEWCYLRAERRE